MSTNPEDTYEEVEEVEVEETDEDEASESHENEQEPPPKTPQKKPGKVTASEEVRKMKMESPEKASKPQAQGLPPTKNPFPGFGAWTPSTFDSITIEVPMLTGKNETTNELTRSNKPEARYWKAPMVFRFGNFTSTTLRFDNVHIPYHTGKNYGAGFVYMCLPSFAADKFAEAGKTRRPTRVTESNLVPDKNRWWKVANNVEDSFGIINNETKKFHKKSLDTIFSGTSAGITATVILSFMFKAATDDREHLKPTTMGTISVELQRGYITSTDVVIDPPVRVPKVKAKVEPTATSKDVATDSVMKRLADLGL